MADNASKVVWTLNSVSQGKVRLRGMKSYSVKSERKKETVNEVGSDDPTGFKRKPGGRTISFVFYQKKGKPIPDWDFLDESDEIVSLTKQVDGSIREQYPECVVSSVDKDGDDDGENTFSVDVVGLRRKKL